MPTEAHRILFYKKMAAVKNVEDVQAVQDELEDRFGDPPKPVWNMLAIIRLRLRCHELGIASIGTLRNQIQVKFGPGVRLDPEFCRELIKAPPPALVRGRQTGHQPIDPQDNIRGGRYAGGPCARIQADAGEVRADVLGERSEARG